MLLRSDFSSSGFADLLRQQHARRHPATNAASSDAHPATCAAADSSPRRSDRAAAIGEPALSAATIRSCTCCNCACSTSPSANTYSFIKHCCAKAQKNASAIVIDTGADRPRSRPATIRGGVAVSNRSSSRSWTTFNCNSASSMASRAIALAPSAPSNDRQAATSRPGIGETLQWRRHRGALLDEDFRITQPERDGIGEMRHRLCPGGRAPGRRWRYCRGRPRRCGRVRAPG